jgi:putative transposase
LPVFLITSRNEATGAKIFSSPTRIVAYLTWLREYSEKFDVEILAYCLMTNHIHLVAVADR